MYTIDKGYFAAVASDSKKTFRRNTELGEDISNIAIKTLDNRKVRTIAKAVLRPAGKYFAERAVEESVRRSSGELPADGISIAGSIYNIYSEQADIRSWQTLPAQIRIARLILSPGDYDLEFNGKPLDHVSLKAGEKKIILKRTSR
jgi:hypothetical protein